MSLLFAYLHIYKNIFKPKTAFGIFMLVLIIDMFMFALILTRLFPNLPDKAIPPYSSTYTGTHNNAVIWVTGEPVTLSQRQIDSIENLKAFDRLRDSISVFSDTLVYNKTFKRVK